MHVSEAYLFGEFSVVGGDIVEGLLLVVHQIHFVHGQDHMPDSQQGYDIAMPPGLRDDALARIDQDHRKVRSRRARCHVAGVLLMAGRVGGDEAALVGGEITVGDVDSDALFALRLQPVHQQRQIDLVALGAEFPAFGFRRRELILEYGFRLVEQAAKQGRFSVIDRTAGQKTQHADLFLILQVGFELGRRGA